MATVKNLIDAAVDLIGDSDNASSYYTGKFTFVTNIVSELVRLGIGVQPTVYTVTPTPDAMAYTPTDTDYQPLALPADLTSDAQIISVDVDGGDCKTETHTATLYMLIPIDYTDDVRILYKPLVPLYASTSTALPISDDAVNTVAAFGLAELLSVDDAEELTAWLSGKYEKAKRNWHKPSYNAGRIRDVYGF